MPGNRKITAARFTLCVLFLMLVWPVILSGRGGPSEFADQRKYHEPVIRVMAEQWPHVDLVNYNSSTAPGYHLAMALIARYATENETLLRLISSLLGLGLLVVILHHAASGMREWEALAVTLPMLGSSYFLGGSMWLTTDNAAWVFVALALGGAVMIPATASRIARWGLYSTLAAFIRQVHLWVIAPVALVALLHSPFTRFAPTAIKAKTMQEQSWSMFAIVLPFLLAPVVLVGVFVMLWGGLMPPAYVEIQGRGVNSALLPVALSLVGVFGVFYLPAFGGMRLRDLVRDRMMWVGLITAILVCVIIPTSYSKPEGRWGGAIWILVQEMPVAADRSLVFLILAPVGMTVLVRAWRRAADAGRGRQATILLFGFLCWLMAQSVNSQAWQRYCEPMILIMLAWLAALALSNGKHAPAQGPAKFWWIGPLILATGQFSISAARLYWRVWQQPSV